MNFHPWIIKPAGKAGKKFFSNLNHLWVNFTKINFFDTAVLPYFPEYPTVTAADDQYRLRIGMGKQGQMGHHLLVPEFIPFGELDNPVKDQHLSVGPGLVQVYLLKPDGEYLLAGDEVVQVYLRDRTASVAQPVKKLVAFRRVTLEPGESVNLEFRLAPATFAIWDIDMRETIEPGIFDIMAGPDSEQLASVELELT